MADAPKRPGQGGQGKSGAAGAFSIKLTKQQQQNIAAAALIIAGVLFVYIKYFFMPNNKALSEKTAVLEQK